MRLSHALGLGTLLCLHSVACQTDHDRSGEAWSAGPNDASADSAADHGGAASALTKRAIIAFDRQIKATCICLVASGVYESEEACFETLGSGPTWMACGSEVLAEHDGPDTREQVDCFIERTEQQADCVEDAACDNDALSQCATVPAQCAETILPELLQRCPDLGLLSRVR